MTDHAAYIPLLLPVAGAALQWTRQYTAASDRRYSLYALLAAVVVYLGTLTYPLADVQDAVLYGLVWIGGVGLPAVVGGTAGAAKLSCFTSLVPRTNSK